MKIISKNEIPIGILNEIQFHGLSCTTFLIDYKNADLISFTNDAEINKKHVNDLKSFNFDSHKIKHKHLINILNNETYEPEDDNIDIDSNTIDIWATEISFKKG